MATTQEELAQELFQIKQEFSNKPDLDPEACRREMAEKEAEAFANFVIGRTTTVSGSSVSGGAVTGTGTIQE